MNYRFDDDGNILPPEPKSITEINDYIKALVEEEALLQDVYVIGEVSNFKNHYTSGHFYFTLKDENSEIRVVMFRSASSKVKFKVQDGMRVVVHGRIGVFSQVGSYQLYVDSMQPDGIGSLHLAFEQLKTRLSMEGLFDIEHKKQLPKYPRTIGIISSSTGAAVRDIIKVATRRYPACKLILFPSLVQGNEAPSELIRGIEYFNLVSPVDVIIIGRGGGSIEDLWAFNDELLARTIYDSSIPIVSAVGHEIDYTICDFVADVRAATPSHAAEIVTPDIQDIKFRLNEYKERALSAILTDIEMYRSRVNELEKSTVLTKPLKLLDVPYLKIANVYKRLNTAVDTEIRNYRERFIEINSKLLVLNPMAVLSRGYGAIFDNSDKIVKSVDDVENGDKINIKIKDGVIKAKVIDKQKECF